MTKYKNMSPAEFTKIKALLDAGVPKAQVSKIMERSVGVIQFISQSKTFEDYKQIVASYYKPKSVAKLQEEAKVEEKIDEVNTTKAVKVNAHAGTEASSLLRIANALERLADAWEAQPKRGIFGNK